MSYALFWVIPRLLNFIFQRIGMLCLFRLHRPVGTKKYLLAYEGGTVRVSRNIGTYNLDTGELPRRKHTTFLRVIFVNFWSLLSNLRIFFHKTINLRMFTLPVRMYLLYICIFSRSCRCGHENCSPLAGI